MNLESVYKTISDLINDSQARGEDIVFYANKMAIDLGNSGIDSEDIERLRLESQIDATSNLLNRRHNSYTTQLRLFVSALQKYVNDNYTSVNDFLSSNSIQVKSVFAEISATVGFIIDPSNIESVS